MLTVLATYRSTGSEAAMHSDEDQRENYRREQEAKRIASLPSTEQQPAKNVEAARQRQYDNKVNGTLTEQSVFIDADNSENRTNSRTITDTRSRSISPSGKWSCF
jgi:hypothetical protein